jgi:hypothetical protein
MDRNPTGVNDTISILQLGDQSKTGKVSVNITDPSSACQFQAGHEAEPFAAFSYMQAINPFLSLGGSCLY